MAVSEAQSLVDRLYAAFNDSGTLGLGGTDEDAVMRALSEAKAKNLMQEVDALYNSRYAEKELPLKDELDDELSGEEFEKAMRLYDEGMAAPKKRMVHGTLTPRENVDVRTFFDNIIIDWENSEFKLDDDGNARTDITKESWEDAVWAVLDFLYNKSPFETARAILEAIKNNGNTLYILVEKYEFGKAAEYGLGNAHAEPIDPPTATRNGGTLEGDPPGTGGGVGGGSDSKIRFTPQDWEMESSSASTRARDEVLLHELFHALRQMRGLEDEVAITAPFETMNEGEGTDAHERTKASGLSGETPEKENQHRQHYGNQEEFFSIVVTNIHRSEKGRAGMKRDHLGENLLVPPMNNAANFASTWKPQLHYLCEDMPDVCRSFAGALGSFNPVFELYRIEGRYPPGTARNAPT